MDRPAAIEVRDLHKSFPIPELGSERSLGSRLLRPVETHKGHELTVLDGVSFTVRKGDFFGILGRNGSGKSTLLRILSSIYEADAGTVRVAGRIAPMIELGVGFDPELSARANVMLNGIMLGLTARQVRARMDEIFEFAEVGDFADLPIKNFSSGMRVRLAFAVMIQADPEIFLIDEILAVGDIGFQEKCAASFEEMRRTGKTVVLVTHAVYDVKRFCDRALLLENGQIEEYSDMEKMLSRYFALVLEHRPGEADPVHGAAGAEDPERPARIRAVRLLAPDGATVTTVEAGAPIEMAAAVTADRPLNVAGVRLEIRTENGARVFAPPDSPGGGEVLTPEHGMTVRASIENRLSPGRYTLGCTLLRENGGKAVAASQVTTTPFEVTGTAHPGAGLVSLQHEVSMESEARPEATPR